MEPRPTSEKQYVPLTMSEEQFLSLSEKEAYDLWDITPMPPVLPSDYNYKDRLFRFANVAVESYNSNHQSNQFEVVDPLHYSYVAGLEHYHLSFIARSKDASSFLKLFFAEVSSSDETVMARKCIIVEPCNPFFVIGCRSCHPEGVVYHPFHYLNPFDYRPPPLYFRSREYRAKRFLSEAYIITSYEQNLNAEDVDELSMTTYGYVREALSVYNDEHCASFEPLGIVASVRFGCIEPDIREALWVHFIFKAMNKDPNLTDASPTYFFAERGLLRKDTTTCVMMGDTYPSSAYPGTETSCAVCRVHCPNMIFHPEDYQAGRYGGNFADALDKDKSRTVKAKLEQKDDDSSKVARLEYLEALEW